MIESESVCVWQRKTEREVKGKEKMEEGNW